MDATASTAEAASLVSYSLMTRSLLPQNRSRFSWLLRSDLTGLGVSHLLPGGGATWLVVVALALAGYLRTLDRLDHPTQ